ncbi:MAG: acyl-ACP--UDP-N-acetylglucosamine O-acyltransferase [Chthoniobacterales bacterium]|nr:acyl-ACP--UDP-N-acetylglucosamine O-acyltransferase [Chthoniobacterales bacterium]
MIHPTAIVDPAAEVHSGARIGPYCIVGPGATIGEDTELQHHVTVMGPAIIGRGNLFYAYSSIGQRTQDLKYAGEPTHLEIGDGNTFREFCTVNRGTLPGAKTVIGSGGNFLSYAHIAHDCTVGSNVIFSNNGTLAGHVGVGDHVIIGGLTAIHQFCRVGRHAIIGGCSKIVQDVPPFFIADGNPAEIRGVNLIGLERAGFPAETVRALKEAYRILYRGKHNVKQAVEVLQKEFGTVLEIAELCTFIESSRRGIIR